MNKLLIGKLSILSLVIAVLAISGLLVVDSALAAGSGSYVRFLNKIHVYDVTNNQFRYVSYDEAMRDNIWNQVKGDIPQSSVPLTGKEDCRVFANLSQWGKGSEVWVQNESVFGEIGFSWSAVQWRVQVPSANTSSFSAVTASSATLTGNANSNGGSNTDVWFDYGVTPSMGQTASASSISGSGSQNVSANIYNLTDNTTYYYRLASRNCRGTAFGSTSSFRTQNTSTPPQQDQGGVPTVSTSSASNISTNSATLNGLANPNNASTTAYFQYGTSASFGSTSSSYNVGSGNSQSSFSAGISGLSDNTTYYFRSVANNSYGTVYGNTLSFTTTTSQQQGGVPTVSTNSASSISTSNSTLNGYVNPNGASTSVWFQYGTSNSFGSTSTSASVGSGNSQLSYSISVSGLSGNTTYYFRSVANNSFGTVYGNTLSFTTTGDNQQQGGVPTVSTNSASNISTNGATLNGSANPNNASASAYFQYGTTTSFGSTSTSINVGSGNSQSNYSMGISGLSDNTTYYFRAVANNSFGTVYGSTSSFTTTTNQQQQGNVPSISTAYFSNISSNSATLNGLVTPNNASTNAWFEYGTSTSLGNSSNTTNLGSGYSQSSYSVNIYNLSQNTTYYYQSVASNNFGISRGSILSFTTSGSGYQNQAGAPIVSTSSVTNNSTNSVTFNALVNPNGALTNSWFDYGTSTNLGSITPAYNFGSGSSSANFYANVSNLSPNTTYYYRVAASNNFGTSRGNILSFTTTQTGAVTTDLSGISYTLAQISVGLNNLIAQLRSGNVNNTYNVVTTVSGDLSLLAFSADKTTMSREEVVVLTAEINPRTTLTNAVLEIALDKDLIFEATSASSFVKTGNVIKFNLGTVPANSTQTYTINVEVPEEFTNVDSKKDKFVSIAVLSYSDSNGRNPNSVTASVSVDFSENTGLFASVINFFSGWNLGIIVLFLVLLLIIGAATVLK
jgi:hypothetical protein